MIKIDFDTFIKDRIWFGWWYCDVAVNPLWMRATTSHWTIIDRRVWDD